MSRLRSVLLVVLVASVACGGGGAPAPAGNATSQSAVDEAHVRLQAANVELLGLLSGASRRNIDITEYRARMGLIVLSSATDMVTAADNFDELVAEVRAVLEQ